MDTTTDTTIDPIELKKVNINKKLFSKYRSDYFEIDTVLEILNVVTLPIEIQMNNNQIFIRDISNYIVNKGLKI
jgi:hypothetical protein